MRATGGKPFTHPPCQQYLGAFGFHVYEHDASFVASIQLLRDEPFNAVDEMTGADRGT